MTVINDQWSVTIIYGPDLKVVVRDANRFSDELLRRIFQVNASVCTLKHKKQLKSVRNGKPRHMLLRWT